jgi:hypothetical protein
MNPESLEGFVDAEQAARFLFLTRRHVLELARAGKLPDTLLAMVPGACGAFV